MLQPMETLPLDLISNILSRLPVKFLLCLKCVCKSWQTLINTPHFRQLHLLHSHSTNTNRHFIFTGTTDSDFVSIEIDAWFDVYSFDLDFPKKSAIKLPLPLKFQTPSCEWPDITVIGCCNGLVCLLRREAEVILLNPETMSFVEFPEDPKLPNCGMNRAYGFGYDRCSDDYKLVRIMDILDYKVWKQWFEIAVYSFRLKSWKLIKERVCCFRNLGCNHGVLINNNLLHWRSFKKFYSEPPSIVSFDFCDEKWRNVPIPKYLESGVVHRTDLAELGDLDGCLCMLTRTYVGGKEGIDVWVMKEYGVKESWMKFLGCDVHPNVTRSLVDPPLVVLRGGHEVLLKMNEEHFRWYNLKHKRLRKTKIRVWPQFFGNTFGVCWRSLVVVPGGQSFGNEMLLHDEEVGSQLQLI